MGLKIKLTIVKGSGRAKGFEFDEPGRWICGRARACDIWLLDPWIGQRHCALTVDPPNVFIEDFGSRNGTFLNGVRCAAYSKAEIRDGDEIRVGGTALQLRIETPEGRGAPRPDRPLTAPERPRPPQPRRVPARTRLSTSKDMRERASTVEASSGREAAGSAASGDERRSNHAAGQCGVVREENDKGIAFLTLSGLFRDGNRSAAESLRDGIQGILDEGVRRIVVDISQVRYLGSVAIAMLVAAWERCNKDCGRTALVAPSGHPSRRKLHLAGLDKVFEIAETRDEAVKRPT